MILKYSIDADGNMSTNGMPRIKALAAIRNAALEPLWGGREAAGGAGSGEGDGGWPATHVAFTNDVFACAEDYVRLLYHEADFTCGFDAYSTRPRVNRFLVRTPNPFPMFFQICHTEHLPVSDQNCRRRLP